MIEVILKLYATLIALMFGSLANVLILRLPKGEDPVFASSHCPSCKQKLRWFMNIPLISFFLLKGKCRFCSSSISWQYPLIELFVAVAGFLLAPKSLAQDDILLFFIYFFIFYSFVIHFVIDVKHQILPDSINLFLLLVVVIYLFFYGDWSKALYGFLVGFGGTYSVTWLFYKFRGVVGLGGGDIKLFGVLGLLLGPVGIIQNIFVSCFLGSLVGVIFILTGKMKKDSPMPFGPFIILTAFWQIFFESSFHNILKLLF